MNNGFVYIASDPSKSPSPYKFNADKKILNLEFKHSFLTLKRHHPNTPVTLFTNYEDLLENKIGVDNVLNIDSDWGFMPKVAGLSNSPYDSTIFLDCDTQINGRIDELFNLTQEYDLAICQEYSNKDILNTGVLALNNRSPFVNLWLKKMTEKKLWAQQRHLNGYRVPNKIPDDQAELNEIIRGIKRPRINRHIKEIQETLIDFKHKVLDSRIYNCRVQELQECKKNNFDLDSIKILHFRNLWRSK